MNEVKEDYNLVTETYDDLDRLIYRNYYKFDVPYTSALNPDPSSNQRLYVPQEVRKPKKLLYQDVYTYKGERRLSPSIKRVYQPVIDFTATRVSNTITLIGNFTCRSKILASGFIWTTLNSEATVVNAMTPRDYFKSSIPLTGIPSVSEQVYKGSSAIGTKTRTINSATTHYVKAFVQIETGTLFSKTITV